MQRQSTYTRESYAIMKSLAKFHHYVLGKHFIIQTE